MKQSAALVLLFAAWGGIAGPAAAGRSAKDEPLSPAALMEKGHGEIARGELDQGIASLTLAREAAPNDPAVYNALATAYAKQGAEPMAVSQFEKSLQLDSLQVEPRLQLAEIHQRNRRWAEAGRLWQQVLRIDSANDPAALGLGRLYLKAKQPAAAANVLAGYVQRHPADEETATQYLDALATAGVVDLQAVAAENILHSRPDWMPALLGAGRARARQGEWERALGHFLHAETLQPLGAADAAAVGRCYLAAKRDAEAAPWFERALADTASTAVDWAEPAAAFMRLKRWPDAEICYQRKLRADSTSVSAWVNYALCKQQAKDYEASRQALLRAVALRPDFLPAQSNLATTYVLLDSTRAARRSYARVIQLAAGKESEYRSELLQAQRYLGVGALLDKNWAAALPHLERALALDPADTEMRLYRAQALLALNRKEEAKQEFETVLHRQPGNKQAKKGLDLIAQYN